MNHRLATVALLAFSQAHISAQSIMEINAKACASSDAAEDALSRVSDQILQANAGDKNFVSAFKAAQKAWLAFREAHMKAIYPDPDPAVYPTSDVMVGYGLMHPAYYCGVLEAMTRDRIKELRKRWIEGTAEDDACAGSSPRRPKRQSK